ncbi:nucleoside monophosphate kinase [Streptomyces tanashiensis]|uniref:nucleoside monophosphate kinase n=1 Tax=Streptomyces tanashiensis TaxID=67367 RepID=UPI0036EC3C60
MHRKAFLFEGFPRAVAQADVLTQLPAADGHVLDAVLEFDVLNHVVVAPHGRGRNDDTEEVIRHRQQVYRSQTAPLLTHYVDLLRRVNSVGSVDEVAECVQEALTGTASISERHARG